MRHKSLPVPWRYCTVSTSLELGGLVWPHGQLQKKVCNYCNYRIVYALFFDSGYNLKGVTPLKKCTGFFPRVSSLHILPRLVVNETHKKGERKRACNALKRAVGLAVKVTIRTF